MDRKDLLKIGDFARLAETNLRTLRYYEELGLLSPAARSAGGFRYYRKTDVNRLNMIRHMQDLGLQLEQVGELMTSREEMLDQEAFLSRVRVALRAQDSLLMKRIGELEDQRMRIARSLTKVTECATCKSKPSKDNNYCEPCSITGMPLPLPISALF
jgi:DNA-binding transcriptional MerR regulator